MTVDYLLNLSEVIERLSNAFKALDSSQKLDCDKQKNQILELISITTELEQED